MKTDPKADAAAAAPASSKKKLLIIIIAALLLAGGGGAAWYFMHDKKEAEPGKAAHKEASKSGPPVFVPLEPFTVNLQPENGDQYLQIAVTLQVSNAEEMELIKLNMPKVRSRLVLLLSSKKASELNSGEGKKQLAADIVEQLKQPFDAKGAPQEVSDVLFTSFIIQ